MTTALRIGAAVVALLAAAGCPGKRASAPRVPAAVDQTVAIEGSIRGVAGDGKVAFAAITIPAAANAPDTTASAPISGAGGATHRGEVLAYRGATVVWRSPIGGVPGDLALGDKLLAVTVSATRAPGGGAPLRGDPAAFVAGLDSASGSQRWIVVVDSTDWSVISSVAAYRDGFVIGGLFGGTLRIADRVVSSAGSSDGFVARLAADGKVQWLVRLGGVGADGVQGVATRADRIAIAGTFTSGAELQGDALPAHDDRSPFGDVFAAELDDKGTRRWVSTFGGRADEAVAGVTIDERGNVVVAASARDVVHVGSSQLVAQGTSDGVVAFFGDGGEKGPAVLVGGLDFDGLRAITAVNDRVIVGGFFSGSIKLADRTLTAGGGDDAFIAVLDHNGTIASAWHVGGEGREEIAALRAIPGGFIAAVAHTASAAIDDAKLASPKDPMLGGAVVVRGMH